MNVLRETTCFCSEACEVGQGQVLEEDGQVYLIHTGGVPGGQRALVEKDAHFYKFITDFPKDQSFPYRNIVIDITSKCNLDCRFCYRDIGKAGDEIPLEEVQRVIDRFRDRRIIFSGGEPTLHSQLPQMIRYAAHRNAPVILTNGLRLTDYAYAKQLKKAGLKLAFFSFNGFDDSVFELINDRPLLQQKLQAIENLKRVGIKMLLSALIMKGVNDNQIGKLFDFYVQNRKYIYELRLRNTSSIGRHVQEHERFCMSELLYKTLEQIGVSDRDAVLRELQMRKDFVQHFPTGLDLPQLCSLDFSLIRKNGRLVPVAQDVDLEKISRSPFKNILLFWVVLKKARWYWVKEFIRGCFGKAPWFPEKMLYRISLKCWPVLETLDLEENQKCTTALYKNGRLLPFCLHNILCSQEQRDKGARSDRGLSIVSCLSPSQREVAKV